MITYHVNEPFNRRKEKKKNKSKSDTAIDPTFNVRLFINVGKIFEVTKIVLAAPEVGDIPEEPEVGNENSDSEPWPRHTSVYVLFSILLSFSFLFYIFFFYFHASTIEQKEGKKKLILIIAIQISFERTTLLSLHFHPVFLFSFFSRNLCSRSFLYNSVAFSFLLPLTIRGSPWSRSYLFPSRKNSTLSRLLSFSLTPSPRVPYFLVFINAWPRLNFPMFSRVLTNFSPCCSSPFVVFY